ncbi:MAG TPA: hypothetical protein VG328_17955 [Stellaceae bacterium]|nr:hypothetical protein [Stellaceae bacterium]
MIIATLTGNGTKMSLHAEYDKEAKTLRHDSMVKAWMAEYQKDRLSRYKDCRRCGWPHNEVLLCFNAPFGELRLGGDLYSICESNVVFFHNFMKNTLGNGWGFHWRDEKFFGRDTDGSVIVRFIEQYNNAPQVRTWRIPAPEWASIVCSVSRDGETGERWEQAQLFHGKP